MCIFLAFNRVFGAVSSNKVLMIAGLAAILRWIAFPVIEPLGLGFAGFFAVQTLHALSTGLLLIGLQKMIGETVPEERTGAAQGVAYFANGFATGVVTLPSGPLYNRLGGDGFYVMAVIALIGFGLIVAAALSPRGQAQAETPASRDREGRAGGRAQAAAARRGRRNRRPGPAAPPAPWRARCRPCSRP